MSKRLKKIIVSSVSIISCIIILLFAFRHTVYALDTGWKFPTQSRNVTVTGIWWADTSHIYTDDNDGAWDNMGQYNGTDRLEGYGYSMNIPTGATINGIIVQYKSRADPGRGEPGGENCACSECYLMKNLSRVGTNQANPYTWASNWGGPESGDSSNLWGTTWTAAELNSSQFGVSFVVYKGAGWMTFFYVDYIIVKVYYTVGFDNIEEINDISATDIEEINGILATDIESINGI